MLVLKSPQVVQQTVSRWKKDHKIAFVPTMGALHEGHLALVRRAHPLGRKVIASIFVNPLQFGPHEDFDHYPRSFEEDVPKFKEAGIDLLFHPDIHDLYPDDFSTRVQVSKLSEFMEGKSRPGHFEGVATVCLKLFQITLADFAVFGEKDYQQLRIIQKMTEDLNLPVGIVPHPTVRESDGLAMSSRNRCLSPEARQIAGCIPQTLFAIKNFADRNPDSNVSDLLEIGRSHLGATQIDYVEIASEKNLAPVSPETHLHEVFLPRLFIAVRIEKTRLIDNAALHGE